MMAPPLSTDPRDVVRVGVYARQSKARLDASETSPEVQLSAGGSLAEARSWRVVREFADIGRSGWDATVVRPEFESMMAAVAEGELDVIIVHELSRLTRQGAYDAMKIDEKLRSHGVRLVSVLEPFIDTSSPIGVAIFALIAALAKQDSDMKSNKLVATKAGIAKLGGRHSSAPPYGMRAVRTTVGKLVVSLLEPEPDTAPFAERLLDLCEAGMSDGQIAKAMEAEGVAPPGASAQRMTEKRAADIAKRRTGGKDRPIRWRAQTVAAIINHPAVGGFASVRRNNQNVIARDDAGRPLAPHTGIVSGDRWLAVQALRKQRSKPRRARPGSPPTLLSGWRMMVCAQCGGAWGRSADAYMCSNPVGHGGSSIKQAILDDYVARRVWSLLTASEPDDPQVLAAARAFARQQETGEIEAELRETQAHLEHVRESIAELQADRLAGLYRGGSELETWRATILQYREYEEACAAKLEDLGSRSTQRVRIPDEWNVDPSSDPVGDGSPWAMWDVFKRRELVALFVDRISVGAGRDDDGKIVPVRERVKITWSVSDGTE